MTSTAKERAIGAFRARFGREPDLLARAPGRVNLIGEHVDYNEGLVLPVAIDRAAWIAAALRSDSTVTVDAIDLGERATFRIAAAGGIADRDVLPGWARYPAGVAAVAVALGLEVAGADVAIASDVPIGAGLSSSAAIEVAFAVMWRSLGGWSLDTLALARLCQRAENEHVGVACGLMDPFTSINGRLGHALLLDCRSLEWKPVRLPADTAIVVADTRVRRELAESEFNTRRRQCEEAVRLLQATRPAIRSLRDVSPAELEARREDLPDVLYRRARHVVEEIARVEAVIPDVEHGDAAALGRAMTAAHRSGRELYEVSCRELDVLVEAAVAMPGCYGARLTGAGFGGCTVNLVRAEAAQRFGADLARAYREAIGAPATIWISSAGAGAEVIPFVAARASDA